tara:strand:- start:9 stop:173 length:165 start_codon:yes stop_codon:yes gene_type:complete
MVDGYTEYGYRGLDELKKANEKIIELQKEIEELKQELAEAKKTYDARMFWAGRQ